MANSQIQSYADMVNLQVASEAFLRFATSVAVTSNVVFDGNRNSSKEPAAIANLFSVGGPGGQPRYKLIAHQDLTLNADLTISGVNNKSGFSASVFLDTTTGKYTLSIRSTEFAGTIRDAADVRVDGVEVPLYGWAFGQINSLEQFWDGLFSGAAVDGANAVTVPSSADLTAFRAAVNAGAKLSVTGYSLGANVAQAFTELHRPQVDTAYFFNGAGTGVPNAGQTLASVWAKYQMVFGNPDSHYQEEATLTGELRTALQQYRANPNATYTSLFENPRHTLAMSAILDLTKGALAASSLLGSTLNAPRTSDDQMIDLFAYHYSGSDILDTATARSGQRHGTSRPIWYEDQPATTWTNGDFSQWDFGLGHSIILLQDSLNLMAAFERLDPNITEDKLAAIFQGASRNNYDSLEKSLDALGKLVNLDTPVAAATADSQYAQMALRNLFFERLKAVQDNQGFKDLAGKLLIRPASADLRAAARNDFGALAALQDLSPIWITGKDAAGDAALATVWRATRNADYSAWVADKSATSPTTFTDLWINDRATLLGAVQVRNTQDVPSTIIGSSSVGTDRVLDIRYVEAGDASLIALTVWNPANNGASNGLSTRPKQLISFGGQSADTLSGTDEVRFGDRIYGGAGSDTLDGKDGNDYLEGGAGLDTYQFTGTFGKDTILDSDGLGKITIGGQTLGTFKGAGTRGGYAFDMGGGQYAGLALVNDASSATGYKAIIVKGTDTANTITLNNFDLAKAQGAGWLGIKIDGIQIALLAQPANFWADPNASLDSLAGKSATLAEEGGISLYISLSQGAKAGDTITLALGDLSGKGVKVIANGQRVDADGAAITLSEGQTQIDLALVQDGDLNADATGVLSVTYQGQGQRAISNTWGLILQDAADPTTTLIGDFKKKVDSNHYVIGSDGNYVADGDAPGALDLITGSAAADKIQGLGGDDALLGKAGDDSVEGGDGNDVLQGGLGADTLEGGAGADVIYGSSTGSLAYPTDLDPQQFPPPTGNIVAQGLGWRRVDTNNDADGAPIVTLTNTLVRDQQTGDQANVIDGGAGDDNIYTGTGDDVAYGGPGRDLVYGMGGSDILLGEADDDWMYGDGPANSSSPLAITTSADKHGADFLDGGEGNDKLYGQGNNDDVFGGDGNDLLYGDDYDDGRTPLAVHGNDYLDGEDGNDTLGGGGKDDTLYGGAGDDRLEGDGGASNPAFHGDDYLDGEEGNDTLLGGGGKDTLYGSDGNDQLAGDTSSVDGELHGADYLDGEEGNDTLTGGGKDDTLYGSEGNDVLQGDDRGAILAGQHHGNDYLDGEVGNDTLIGGGKDDTLYGGEGNDVLGGDDDLTLLAAAFHGDDQLDGGDGNDRLVGGGGNDQIAGGTGNDVLVGDAGDDATGVNGNDILDGGDGADALLGNGGNDQLSGGAGDDTLLGGAGDDHLDGGSGANYLLGGEGNDTLVVGAADYLEGGAGDDTYIVSGAGTTIPVIDDSQGRNTVILNGSAQEYTPYTSGGMTFLVSGGNTVVGFAAGTNLGGIWIADGADGKTVLQLALDHDPAGRSHSASWVDGQLVSTTQISTNQTLQAGTMGAALDGGSGDDQIVGGIGDDALTGGAGNDLLTGGAGADVIAGGAGNDILIAGSTDAADDSVDVYQFAAGDGADRIEAPDSAGNGVARDVISFGPSVDAASVRFIRGESSVTSAHADLVIAYGNGDTITLAAGAFEEIAEIRFADGSHLSRGDVLQRLTQADGPAAGEPVARDEHRSGADLLLAGGESADRLTGGAGDDTLVGGAGSDLLAGGAGRNVYVFAADSGADLISPDNLPGLEQTLQFTETALGDLRAFVDGSDVLVQQGSGAFVRIGEIGLDQNRRADWWIIDRNGQQMGIAQLLDAGQPDQASTPELRRQEFLARQRMQLTSMPQRMVVENSEVQHPSIPKSVTVVHQAVAPDPQSGVSRADVAHYLITHELVQVTTTYVSSPIYASVVTHTPGTPQSFISVGSLDGTGGVAIPLPPGAVPVYGQSDGGGLQESGGGTTLRGYMVPARPPSEQVVQRLVGFTATPVTQTTIVPDDAAIQTEVTGSEASDVIFSGAQSNGAPALFRGSIATGGGNDSILLAQIRPNQSPDTYNDGLGAWIDAGDGDDLVRGSDSDDFIIGGAGNDTMDGQGGADTYFVSSMPGEVDHISDLAEVPFGPDGGNDDTVEFDATVQSASLSYHIREDNGGGETVQLFRNGHHFLDIDGGAGEVGHAEAGIEWIQFAGGTRVAFRDLLDSMPVRETTAPEVTTPIGPQRGFVNVATAVDLRSHFHDPDGGTLAFHAELADGSALPSFMQVNDYAGVIAAFAGLGDVGSYSVRVVATDGEGQSAAVVFTFDVAAGQPRAPELTSPIESQHGVVDSQMSLAIATHFHDPDGDTLTFRATLEDGSALPGFLHIDENTGLITGLPHAGDVGVYSVRVLATDSEGLSTAAVFAFDVAARQSRAPELTSPIESQHGVVDMQVSLAIAAHFQDPDGDTLTFRATLEDGSTLPGFLHIDGNTGLITGLPHAGDVGSYSVRVLATDSEGLSTAAVFALDVAAGQPRAPELTSPIESQHGVVDAQMSLATASHFADPDGDTLTFRAALEDGSALPGFLHIDENTGLITGLPQGGDVGSYSVRVVATDSGGLSIATVFALGVSANGPEQGLVLVGTDGDDSLAGMGGDDLIDGGPGNDNLQGNGGNDTVIGGAGNDQLAGQEGANVLIGGQGDDVYIVQDAGDIVVEADGEGHDVVWLYAPVNFTAGAGVEDVYAATGTADPLHVVGNALDNQLTSGGGSDLMEGLAGADALYGGDGGNDTLSGGDGNDVYTLWAGAGLHTIIDSDGFDTLVLDAWTLPEMELGNGDLMLTNKTTGQEIHIAGFDVNDPGSVSPIEFFQFTGANGQTVTLGATDLLRQVRVPGGPLALIGTAGDDSLEGLAGDDLIDGGAGNDTLQGNAGNDTLIGGTGDDWLAGGDGANVLIGGAGDDGYIVQDARDTVVEAEGEGHDVVWLYAPVNFAAGAGVEDVYAATGTADPLHIVGNALDNNLSGGDGDDLVEGLAGADTLYGGDAGNDTLAGGDGNSTYSMWGGNTGMLTIVDSGGVDTLQLFEWALPDTELGNVDLFLTNKITGARVRIEGFNATDPNSVSPIEFFQFTDAEGNPVTLSATELLRQLRNPGADAVPVVVKPLVDQGILEGASWSYSMAGSFSDADGDPLTYSATLADGSALPAWLNFDAATQSFSGAPDQADVGNLTIVVTAEARGATSSDGFVLAIANVNDAPVVSQALVAQQANENQVWSFTVPAGTFTDVDAGDTLAYSATLANGGALPSWIGFNAATRTFSGTPLNADVGTLSLNVTAADRAGATAGQAFTVTIASATGQIISGTAAADRLVGGPGSDRIDGLAGADTMSGGGGDDTYFVNSVRDVVVEGTNAGYDRILSSLTYTAPSNVDALTLTGVANISATGNALDNELLGNSGKNKLDGGPGADKMVGSLGNDTYTVDDVGDVVIESAGEGADTVLSSISYTLGANLENLTLTGGGGLTGTGNELANVLDSSEAGSVLEGLGGDDTLRGGDSADVLNGGDGDDRLDGGAGADQMRGGAGKDVYVADNVGDTAIELVGEGTDTVQSAVTFTLSANVENLTLTGADTISGTGNELRNVISGNAVSNTLSGLGGDDTLRGGASADVLNGGAGNDRLDGGGDADQMLGGAGNDVYVIDDIGDTATEVAGDGTDTVHSSVNFTLGAHLENLTLTGSASIAGVGNELSNALVGNAAPNQLRGLAGDDTLKGGAADDTLEGGAGKDRVNGGLGGDTYLFARGDGQDTLVDVDSTAGVEDVLQFGSDIVADQLWLRKVGNNLEVSIIGAADKITVSGWYGGSDHHVETFKLANGQRLLDSQVQTLVQAMAAFAPPPAGQTTLPPSYSAIETVVAANWQ